jgi:carbon-monoxide dehydrogenase medium subunit
MIPAAFDYARARTLDEALDLVAAADPSIRVLAGGQSLIPLMKLRLARPQRLVDLRRVTELRGVHDEATGGLRIGALTTWADLLADERVLRYGALADALPVIGDVQVRNMGTLGGSLAHADPASDIAAPALALGFEVHVRSAARGGRSIPITELFAGPFATTIAPDEILTEVRVPAAPLAGASAYAALPQPASGYPIAGVAVALSPVAGSPANPACAIGVTGVGERPYRAFDVEAAVAGGTPLAEAIATIAAGQRVAADIHADREYRAAMALVMARRAFGAAAARQKG